MELSCVLIVDDNNSDQFINKDLLESECPDTIILQAYDGEEALEILDSAEMKPDLILLDINMPRMNGHEFLEIYDRKPDSKKPSEVVMLSSSIRDEDRDKAIVFKCVVDFFQKPLDENHIESLKMR